MEQLEIIKATIANRTVFRNLMHLYLYDFSEYTGDDVDENGFFEDEYLDRYWVEPTRHAFLAKVGGKYAGFALVREIDPAWVRQFGIGAQDGERIYAIAEFFVMRKYRRMGLGRALAFAMFDRFSGRWWVSQEMANIPSQAFWRRVIGDYTGGNFDDFVEPTQNRPTQVFTTPRR